MSRHRTRRQPIVLAVDPLILGLAIALAVALFLATAFAAW